jgi:hypothetical protein
LELKIILKEFLWMRKEPKKDILIKTLIAMEVKVQVKGSLKFNPRNRSKKNGYISKSLFLF